MQEKEKARALVPASQAQEKSEHPKKSYWARISEAYTVVYRALLLVLPLFAVLFVITCSRAFSYDSLYCFVKDLQSAASFIPSDYQTVSYTYTEGESYTLSYRGGVAHVGSGGIEVYSPDGERLLDVSDRMKSPRAVASHKYLLSYDFGGTSFTVTNAYAKLYSGEAPFPIYGAAVSDTGYFALITASDQYLSQVLIYDANFNLMQRFGRASATTAISLSDNGRYVAITGISSTEGKRQSVVDLYRVGIEAPAFQISLAGELSLALSFTDNRHIALLTDKALRVLDLDGEWKDEVLLEGARPIAYDFSEEGVLLCAQSDALNAESRVIVLDKKGALQYERSASGDIYAASLSDDKVLLLKSDAICSISADGAMLREAAIEAGAVDMFAVDGEHLRVVYPDKAVYLHFDEL